MPVEIRMTVRLPLAVHVALKRAAKESGRSLNAELVEQLNQGLGGVFLDERKVDRDVLARLADMEARIAKLENGRK